ncbi:SDR family oxidoreductase [Inquilinus limosus]|uniref:3-oxoacyl-ACP reductase n=1 Tax=Inquilinus limosus MP06 TaxID=1398085 RepID=A0A0A0D381_9PROT|nr:SDR family oxidoreductase [Inquilinus limosus]KGM32445.1 3-oxoacyl-ACP reductase [Inquilinus limosus MP06]
MGTTERVAIVTAASKGMGAAIARELARRGYRLALFATSDAVTALAQELGGIAVQGSVTEPADLQRLVDATLERWGRIDALVNNTGHPPKGDLLAIPDADWHLGLDLILVNVVRLARLVTPTMEQAGKGAIVNISAFGAAQPGAAFPVSSVLRAGLSAFTKLYADRYAEAGIRMNSVLPGFIDSYPEKPELIAQIPAKRFGTVEEIAATTAFLLSDEAAYITGQNLLVDGGLVKGI